MSDRLRIPDFYKLSVEERLRIVHERGLLSSSDFRALATGKHTLELGPPGRAALRALASLAHEQGLASGRSELSFLGEAPRRTPPEGQRTAGSPSREA